ncbi:oxidoreductase [Comamonas testosteroni]|uniref:Short-chain dehydrogenase n=1 Tax=Comamonas testosteroni TaxID=285 RepID=A0A096FDT4_COMTE|nr:oxidoreductase [Comamonas testosteroni]KGH28511.1 short-chain dehydrogenase [Comamonas testosteroni]
MKNWLITGVSSGFGRALAEKLIQRGDTVVGTVRNEKARLDFEALGHNGHTGQVMGVLLDVTEHDAIAPVIQKVQERIGHIDVLVNNAGYGVEGAIEETPMDVVRQQYEVNVFGAIAMIQAVLPGMRNRRSGHVVNITSVGGLLTFPGVGVYNSSKFALEGISEALLKEVGHLGIRVTAVEPGAFRTDWAGRSMHHIESTIADYEDSVGAFRAALAQRNGRQPGDPRKAADAIMLAVDAQNPPLHLVLGPTAFAQVGQKLGAMQAELMQWASVSVNTDFPAEA